MKIISILLAIFLPGGVASATTIIQTNITWRAGNFGTMTFARFDTSLGELAGMFPGVSFLRTGGSLAFDRDDTLGGAALFRHDIEVSITSGTVNVGQSSTGNTVFERGQSSFTVGGDGVDDSDRSDIGASDYSVYIAATKNTTFATENIDSDSWTNYVGTGTYDIDFRRFNCIPPRE